MPFVTYAQWVVFAHGVIETNEVDQWPFQANAWLMRIVLKVGISKHLDFNISPHRHVAELVDDLARCRKPRRQIVSYDHLVGALSVNDELRYPAPARYMHSPCLDVCPCALFSPGLARGLSKRRCSRF